MTRTVGTVVRGIRAPMITQGDDIVEIVIDSLLKSCESEGYELRDGDVVGVKESVVARSQGNYVTVDDVANEISRVFGKDDLGVVFPILSRNRFSVILRGLARGSGNINLFLSYPSDEVGNPLMDIDEMDRLGINPHTDVLTEQKYRKMFGDVRHPFTGVDYVSFYRGIIESEGTEVSFWLANDPRVVPDYTSQILAADIHTRARTKRLLRAAGAATVLGLDDLCTTSVNGIGYNQQYGLLGSNMMSDEKLKLFPRIRDGSGRRYVEEIQRRLKEETGQTVEVMIYADGAFKDPAAGIWELADPVVGVDHTCGLKGTPSELKLKYHLDNSGLRGEEAEEAMKKLIEQKNGSLVGNISSQGTTPRQYTDLLGSLFDLVSGSGDKGTPIVLAQGYFDNFVSR